MHRRDFLRAAAMAPLAAQLSACAGGGGHQRLMDLDGPPETVGLSRAGLEALRSVLRRQVDAESLSGIVHMLARHGKIVSFEAYGMRSTASGDALARDALFRIHSQTKPVVAAAMMILLEEGRWRLEDPITRFIPEFANLKVLKDAGADGQPVLEDAQRPPTMQELMCHTAGFAYGVGGDTYADQRIFDEIWHEGRREFMSYDRFISILATIPLLFQPGTNWKYSIAADLQGVLIERMSGMPFPDFLSRRIFTPLGMSDTGFLITPEQAARLAGFYILDESGALIELTPTDDYIFPIDHTRPAAPFYSGGGGLVSSAADFARFLQMLLNGGQYDGVSILSAHAVELMTGDQVPRAITPQVQAAYGGVGQSFGFGMAVLRDPARAGLRAPVGTVLWGGMGGTWFMLDKQNDLFFLGMVQRAAEVPPEDNLPTAAANAIYAALTHPER